MFYLEFKTRGDKMIQKDFGERVRYLRKQTGLSQEKFALKIEMDRTYLASVEAGKRNISIVNIKKIADGLGIATSELFKNI
jgi:regulatory protein munI